mmetsp:Transcript_66922/g.131750  ORF Transcript_66922/g.131750 Transcript_66922/m.131750 type:complete len:318 (-) Transcript_66922:439-1392(-)
MQSCTLTEAEGSPLGTSTLAAHAKGVRTRARIAAASPRGAHRRPGSQRKRERGGEQGSAEGAGGGLRGGAGVDRPVVDLLRVDLDVGQDRVFAPDAPSALQVALAAEDEDRVAVRRGGETEAIGGNVTSGLPLVAVRMVDLDIVQGHGMFVGVLGLAADDMQSAVHRRDRLVAAGHRHGPRDPPRGRAYPDVKALQCRQWLHEVVGVIEPAEHIGAVAHHNRSKVAALMEQLRALTPGRAPRFRRVEDPHRLLRGPIIVHVVASDHVDLPSVGERAVVCRRRGGIRKALGKCTPLAAAGVENVDGGLDLVVAVRATE